MKIGIAGLFFGVAFGFLLGWAKVSEPTAIQDMLLLRDPYLFLMMGSGVATAFVGLRVLRWSKAKTLIGSAPVELKISKVKAEHVWGSLIFGAGWAVALACPGPATAAIGQGKLSGLVVAVGLLSGVTLAGILKDKASKKANIPAVAPASAVVEG